VALAVPVKNKVTAAAPAVPEIEYMDGTGAAIAPIPETFAPLMVALMVAGLKV
jgi:hypothetical protein